MFTRTARRRLKRITIVLAIVTFIVWQVRPRLVRVPQDIDVLEGESSKLTCDVTSLLQAKISWSFNGAPIHHHRFKLDTDGNLLLHHVKMEDAGTYRCMASSFFVSVAADAQVRVFRRQKRIVLPEADAEDMCKSPEGRSEKNLFFVETTGYECLTTRQACTVESAARTNPHLPITVYMQKTLLTDHNFDWNSGRPKRPRSCRITDSLRQFENVKFVKEELAKYTRDTPLWVLHENFHYNDSYYPVHHRSDAVRVAILWKYGGIYLDLDCMVFRPLHCLENTVGVNPQSDKEWVENGVMIFDAGHPFLHFLMRFMDYNYNEQDYISIGPSAVTDAFKHFCNMWYKKFKPSVLYECINGTTMTLQRQDAFYAINNLKKNRKKFYEPDVDDAVVDSLKNSFLLHMYGAEEGHYIPEGSLYGLLAQEYCPTVYAMALGEGGF